MTVPVELIKVQNFVVKRWRLLLTIFILVLVFSTISLYRDLQTKYEYKNVVTSNYIQHGDYTYSVPVTQANPIYSVGTILDSGLPAYFSNVSPTVNMIFAYRIDPTESVNVAGTIQTLAVASGTVKDGDNKTTYWKKEFTIKTSSFSISDQSPIENSFTVNIPDIQTMTKSISEQLNYTDETTITVVNRVTYGGTINGENVNNVSDFALPITVTNAYYQIPNDELVNSYQTNTMHFSSVPKMSSLKTVMTPFLTLMVSIIICLSLMWVHKHRKEVEPAYIAILEKEQKEAEFKDSVTEGAMPKNHTFAPVVVNSLKGLVDAAVDINSRVIFDKDMKTYFTISGGVIYLFTDSVNENVATKSCDDVEIVSLKETKEDNIPVSNENNVKEDNLSCFHGKDANPRYEIIQRTKQL